MRDAWKSQGTNQRELVEQLRTAKIIRTDAVQKVMELVDRRNYCFDRPLFESESESDHLCYADRALGIGLGQTISAPHMHAYALEEIYPSVAKQKFATILDVGCGSGYLTACFGRWMLPPEHIASSSSDENDCDYENENNEGGGSKVFGIDVRQDLVDRTRTNLERQDGDLLAQGVVDISLRDGWKGLPEHAPFDAIHVGAAAETLPKILANQLTVGGVLIIPIGPQDSNKHQVLYKIRRIGGSNRSGDEAYYSSAESFCKEDFEIKSLLGVRYVPLVRGEEL